MPFSDEALEAMVRCDFDCANCPPSAECAEMLSSEQVQALATGYIAARKRIAELEKGIDLFIAWVASKNSSYPEDGVGENVIPKRRVEDMIAEYLTPKED